MAKRTNNNLQNHTQKYNRDVSYKVQIYRQYLDNNVLVI